MSGSYQSMPPAHPNKDAVRPTRRFRATDYEPPVKIRAGRCTCGKGRCLCNGYEAAGRRGGWDICACGHTQAVHALIEPPTP